MANNKITATCYGEKHHFPSRKAAEDFFWECVELSEGAERDRYINILLQLRKGKTICTDQ